MYGQAHAGLGWVIGTLAPHSDRRLRVWCTAAAILPDIDALTALNCSDEMVLLEEMVAGLKRKWKVT